MSELWEIKIRKVGNGLITTDQDGIENIYEIKDRADETNRDHFITLLYDLINFFAEDFGRHDKRRIVIGYRKGDKYEGRERIEDGVEFPVLKDI